MKTIRRLSELPSWLRSLHPSSSCFLAFLNSQTQWVVQDAVTPLSESEAVDLVEDVFASAMERDIYTVSFSSSANHLLTKER